MKKGFFAGLLLLAMLLTGCGGLTGTAEELLSAPRIGAEQSAITDALDAYADNAVRLKYPRRGEFLSPFFFSDFDGDGTGEAIVFFSDETVSKNVHLAVLTKTDDEWQVVSDTEGLGTDIDTVATSDLYGDGRVSLVVGYTSLNLSDRYLAVYNYKGSGLAKLYDQSYSEYIIADFTGTQTEDLAILSPATQPGPIEASLITVKDGTLATINTVTLDNRLQSCVSFAASRAGDGGIALIVDGVLSGNALATEVLRYDNNKLVTYSFEIATDIVGLTTRENTALRSRDIDRDGVVEAPVVFSTVRDGAANARWQWVGYYDFTDMEHYQNNFRQTTKFPRIISSALTRTTPLPAPPPASSESPVPTPTPAPTNEKVFGVLDLKYNCFIPLPVGWKNNIELRSLAGDDWCIVKKNDANTKLITLQMVEKGAELADNVLVYGKKEDYNRVATSAGRRIYARVLAGAGANPGAILNSITILN